MNVSGTKELSAPRDVVWGVINEPAEMAKLMPGVESFEVKDDRHWSARVKVPLGLGALAMTMNFERLEERAPEFASMRAKGTGVGALMDIRFHWRDPEAGAILFARYDADIPSAELAERLRVEQSVLIVPGSQFGVDRYVRFGLGMPTAFFQEGLDRIAETLGSVPVSAMRS